MTQTEDTGSLKEEALSSGLANETEDQALETLPNPLQIEGFRSLARTITPEQEDEIMGYPGKPGPKPDFSWHAPFLEAMARLGNVAAAARSAGVHKDTVYKHRKLYASFARQWTQSLETAYELLEQEAWRRATVGTILKRTTERTNPDGTRVSETVEEQKVSDQLLIFLLKANKPEKYRERYDVAGGLFQSGEGLTIRLAFDPTPAVEAAPALALPAGDFVTPPDPT